MPNSSRDVNVSQTEKENKHVENSNAKQMEVQYSPSVDVNSSAAKKNLVQAQQTGIENREDKLTAENLNIEGQHNNPYSSKKRKLRTNTNSIPSEQDLPSTVPLRKFGDDFFIDLDSLLRPSRKRDQLSAARQETDSGMDLVALEQLRGMIDRI